MKANLSQDIKTTSISKLMVELSAELSEGIEFAGIISDDSSMDKQRQIEIQDMILSVRLAMQKVKTQANKSKADYEKIV